MAIEEISEDMLKCPQIEMQIIGTFAKRPETFFSYNDAIKNNDFSDGATRYWHAFLNDYFLTYSMEVSPALFNVFASMNTQRLSGYKKFGGFKVIQEMMEFSLDDDSLMNAVNTLKKFTLVRELSSNNYPVENIVGNAKFNIMTAEDVANIIRGKVDKICNDAITNLDAPTDMAKNTVSFVDDFFTTPSMGARTPWQFMNDICMGINQGDTTASLAISNSGKGRNLIALLLYLAFSEGAKVYLCSNEMSTEKQRRAVLCTAVNSPWFQKIAGIGSISIPEKRLVLASYTSGKSNELMYRSMDKDGNYTETIDEFRQRVAEESYEYQQVKATAKYLEENMTDRFLFKECGANYDDVTISRLFKQAVLCSGAEILAYDTLKPNVRASGKSGWEDFYRTTTVLQECIQSLRTAAGIFTIQASRDAVHKRIEELSQDSIASASLIFQLFDCCYGWLHMNPQDYGDYAISYYDKNYGEVIEHELDKNKRYCGVKILKNRRNGKSGMYAWEVDLNTNQWVQCPGELVCKKPRATNKWNQ